MPNETEEKKTTEIQIINLTEAKAAMAAFQKFKSDVLTDQDFFVMPNDKNVKHVKKSGWMKYAMALGITINVYDEHSEQIKWKGLDVLAYHFSARAIAPSGRVSEAIGSASSDEGKPWADQIHSIRAMAQTRAVERAISNLVGGGEVGAEELDTRGGERSYPDNPQQNKPRPRFEPNRPTSREMGEEEVSGEQDLADAMASAGLDPQGVEIVTRDFGKFIIKPNWPKSGDKEADNALWRKYDNALRAMGAKYHGKDDPNEELRYNWGVGL
jgi:hypothetical protein